MVANGINFVLNSLKIGQLMKSWSGDKQMAAAQYQLLSHMSYESTNSSLEWNKKPTRCHLVLYLFLLINCSL